MIDISKIDYSLLDRPEIFMYGLKDYMAAIQKLVNQLKVKEDRP